MGSIINIIYQDEKLLAVQKPAKLAVHKSDLVRDRYSLLGNLRSQLGQKVHIINRLDRPVSGVVLVALDSQTAGKLSIQFQNKTTIKKYLAVVRGHLKEKQGIIETPLKNKKDPNHPKEDLQEAVTHYRVLKECSHEIANKRFETSRYSLLEIIPVTGRYHQIRRHLKSINHPIIGDTSRGDLVHNKIFRDHFGNNRILLHSSELTLIHPHTNEELSFKCPLPQSFREVLYKCNLLIDIQNNHAQR